MKLIDLITIISFLTLFTGIVTLADMILIYFTKPKNALKKTNVLLDYSRSLFPVFLIVLILRSFICQPYHVPSESLEPTVMPGDFLLATQYDYGLKLPLWNKTIIPIGHPERGQIAIFNDPVNPTQITLVKRVIGVPGDHISYINKVLYINGKAAKQTFIKNTNEVFADGHTRAVKEYKENLDGVKHLIIVNPDAAAINFKDIVVPKDKYFMMGDNRDDSDDSRYWGFSPINYFSGHARFIWLNATLSPFHIQWNRIGNRLQLHN